MLHIQKCIYQLILILLAHVWILVVFNLYFEWHHILYHTLPLCWGYPSFSAGLNAIQMIYSSVKTIIALHFSILVSMFVSVNNVVVLVPPTKLVCYDVQIRYKKVFFLCSCPHFLHVVSAKCASYCTWIWIRKAKCEIQQNKYLGNPLLFSSQWSVIDLL